ncbi:dimethyl sulfoxide reductase anchor subunit family protein [Nocardioides pacificus]
MHTDELPLVLFTILAQLAVGSFVVLGVIHLVARLRGIPDEQVDKLSDPALYVIGPVMVLGLAASMLHLGNPINALNAVRNIDSSWLSREILLGSAFAALGAAFAATQWFGWLTPRLRQLLAGLTALVGLGLVFAMSMVYMLPTVPAWDTWATPVSFFTTTFLLGTLNIGAAFVGVLAWRRRRGIETDEGVAGLVPATLRGVAAAAIVLVGVEFVVLPTHAMELATAGGASATSADAIMAGGGAVFAIRLALVFLGAGLLGLLLHRVAQVGRERLMLTTVTVAFALVLTSETIGRVLFYDGMVRIGM